MSIAAVHREMIKKRSCTLAGLLYISQIAKILF
jgi:hypothetical protein